MIQLFIVNLTNLIDLTLGKTRLIPRFWISGRISYGWCMCQKHFLEKVFFYKKKKIPNNYNI